MSRVLIVNPTYLPGYRAGGPQRTVQNICDVFSPYNDIYIVTQNVDYGDDTPYDIETNVWLERYGVHIMYVAPAEYNAGLFRKLYGQFDVIYACGLFCKSTIACILLKKRGDGKKLYVAPMGVFSKNALAIRGVKKELFLRTFAALGQLRKIIWSFTSQQERAEATEAIGERNIRACIIAEDLPRRVDFDLTGKGIQGKGDKLRILFLSRIVPKKNLLYALEILGGVTEEQIVFDVYGFREDEAYWQKCEAARKHLPRNIVCSYKGSVDPEACISVFSQYDCFLFPTLGENFGHVIYESMAGGCVPIISDTTPWQDFDAHRCGKVIRLEDIEGFRAAVRDYAAMDAEAWMAQKANAIRYAEQKYRTSVATSGYRAIFDAPETPAEEHA